MIEINLLSAELKTKEKKLNIKPGFFLYSFALAFGILLCTHVFLGLVFIIKSYQFRFLSNKWHSLEPQRNIAEDFKKEYAVITADAKIIQQLNHQRINWAAKLNRLSLNLPSGIWFNEISVSHKDFALKASVVSLKKEEMGLINQFIGNLKNDADFFKDFNSLELSSVQRRVIGGYEMIDFTLIGSLKTK